MGRNPLRTGIFARPKRPFVIREKPKRISHHPVRFCVDGSQEVIGQSPVSLETVAVATLIQDTREFGYHAIAALSYRGRAAIIGQTIKSLRSDLRKVVGNSELKDHWPTASALLPLVERVANDESLRLMIDGT